MSNYGYDVREIAKKKIVDIDWQEVAVRHKAFLENYFRQLRAL
jgi:hypothetical protein